MRTPEINEYIRHHGTLVEINTIPPKPVEEVKEYIFEIESAVCEIRFNGEEIRHLQELNDHYGKGTGVKTAIEDMKSYCTGKKISASSDIEVVVIRKIEQQKALPKNTPNLYDDTFCDFTNTGFASKTISEDIVWSSKTP